MKNENLNNLIQIENKDGILVVSSRRVAEVFNKIHTNVIRDLEEILKNSQNSNLSSDIILSSYKAGTGKNYKEYLLTKKGLNLYLFNIQGFVDYKIAFLDKFEEMEQALLNQAENKIEEEKEEDNNISLYYKNEFVKTDKIQEYIINDPLLGYNFFRYKIVNERPLLNIGDIVRMIDYEQKISPFVNDLWKGLDFVYDLLDNKSTKNKTLSYYLHKFRVEYMFIKNNDLFIEEKKNPLEIYLELQEQKRLGERLRSATELANELDISAQMVGRIANKLDIKDKEHGDWFIEKNKLGRDCQVFKYNQKGFNEIKQHLISR